MVLTPRGSVFCGHVCILRVLCFTRASEVKRVDTLNDIFEDTLNDNIYSEGHRTIYFFMLKGCPQRVVLGPSYFLQRVAGCPGLGGLCSRNPLR